MVKKAIVGLLVLGGVVAAGCATPPTRADDISSIPRYYPTPRPSVAPSVKPWPGSCEADYSHSFYGPPPPPTFVNVAYYPRESRSPTEDGDFITYPGSSVPYSGTLLLLTFGDSLYQNGCGLSIYQDDSFVVERAKDGYGGSSSVLAAIGYWVNDHKYALLLEQSLYSEINIPMTTRGVRLNPANMGLTNLVKTARGTLRTNLNATPSPSYR